MTLLKSEQLNMAESTPSIEKKVLAEFIGTFMFVFVGAGSAIGAYLAFGTSSPGLALLIAALGNGIGLGVSISATLVISGGALNPAVTIGLLVGGKLPARDALPYIVAEVFGAILSVLTLAAVVPRAAGNAVYWGSPAYALASGQTLVQAIGLEAVLTFFLVFVVYGAIVNAKAASLMGLAVGLIVLADVFIGGPLTGAAMNPARAIGPEVVAFILTNHNAMNLWYVFWIGPIAGGILAGLAWRALKM
jgi:MIP family channel proteins